ncbi:MAG: DUF1573 domain-containing protein [Phycisphaerae bacterium]
MTDDLDFGTVAWGDESRRELVIANPELSPVTIGTVRASCDCVIPAVKLVGRRLAPGERFAIPLVFRPTDGEGPREVHLAVSIGTRTLSALMRGVIEPDWRLEPLKIDLGELSASQGRAVVVRASPGTGRRVQLLGVSSDEGWVIATVGAGGTVNISADPRKMVEGANWAFVEIRTDAMRNPTKKVLVMGRKAGRAKG